MTCVGAGNAAKNEGNKNEDKKQQRKRLKDDHEHQKQKQQKQPKDNDKNQQQKQRIRCFCCHPYKDDSENLRKRLKEFERGGVQKYLKEKLYEGEKGETDKKADTMLHE